MQKWIAPLEKLLLAGTVCIWLCFCALLRESWGRTWWAQPSSPFAVQWHQYEGNHITKPGPGQIFSAVLNVSLEPTAEALPPPASQSAGKWYHGCLPSCSPNGRGKLFLWHWWIWPLRMCLDIWCPSGLYGLQCFGLLECGPRWRRWTAARCPQAWHRCRLSTSSLCPRLFQSSLWRLIMKSKYIPSCWPQNALCNK